MKKLLLITAILAIGATAFGVSNGTSVNGDTDTMYSETNMSNTYSGKAGGFDVIKDITSTDNAVHNDGAVNIFRDKSNGWVDEAQTDVTLRILKPIKIESEIDTLYLEAVQGDELEIGDIGFKVDGEGNANIKFNFVGDLFDISNSYATIKGFDGFYPQGDNIVFGEGTESTNQDVFLYGLEEDIEIDLYFDLREVEPGDRQGTIYAKASYL